MKYGITADIAVPYWLHRRRSSVVGRRSSVSQICCQIRTNTLISTPTMAAATAAKGPQPGTVPLTGCLSSRYIRRWIDSYSFGR
eukprot:CCRYP_021135-RC/>CCRYP_021135-RC protein AED:0.12 eAED:0.13 QI:0/0.75/0.8/1/0.5/0.2/5/4777/83